ncbi:MAG: phage tail tape measure protein [Candidatus Limousia pullorum]
MASNREQEIRTKIAVDGESEYRKACQDINASLRALDSELKLTAARFDDNADSIEALTAKQDILSKKYDEQKLKVAAAEEMLRKYAEAGKENSKEAKNMETQLNKAKLALVQTEKELKKTAEQLDDAKKATNEFDDTLEDMSDTADKSSGILSKLGDSLNVGSVLKGGVTAAAAGVAALGTAAAAAGKYALDFSGDVDTAMNSFQATTGIATEQAGAFEDAMLDIYNDNFGEDLTDISEAMSEVARQTKEVDPTKVAELTENALMLRDVFGYDVNEQVRAANMLMEQFGISGDEAFTLIAQGAQKGLDKNGDMLDTINEYAVQFKSLGFDAEDMFSILISGAESGAFSVDKVGDAVKEFGIRVKDGSESTVGAFEDLGLNAKEISQSFADGGDKAQEAFKKVTDALFAMEDPLKQNQTGVALFGTMWEDLGVDGVKALTTLTKQVDKTADTLDDMNDIKYDDLESAFEGIKRSIETGFVLPLGEQALPAFKDFAETISEGAKEANGDIEKMSDVFGDALGDLASDLTELVPEFVDIGGELVTGLIDGIAEAAPELGEAAGKLYAEFLNNLPKVMVSVFEGGVQLVKGFISGLVEGVPLLDALFGDIVNRNKEVYEALEINIDKVTSFAEAIKNAEPNIGSMDDVLSEYGNTVDEINSKISSVQDGITEILANALQEQRDLREEDLQSIRDYIEELNTLEEELLETYRLKQLAQLDKLKADRENLQQEDAAQYLANAEETLRIANETTDKLYTERLAIIENSYRVRGEITEEEYQAQIQAAKAHYDEEFKINQQYYDEAVGIVSEVSEEWVQVDKEKWEKLAKFTASYGQNTNGIWQGNLSNMLKTTFDYAWNIEGTYNGALSQMNLDNANAFLTMVAQTKAYGGELPLETQIIAQNMLTSFDGLPANLDESGKQALLSLISGLDYYVPDLKNATDMTASDIVSTLRNEWGLDSESEFANAGLDAVWDLKEAIENDKVNIWDVTKAYAKEALNGIQAYNGDENYSGFYGAGSNASIGFGNGLRSNDGWVDSLAAGLASISLSAMQRELDSHSPSRKFMKLGAYSAQGYTIGFEKEFARSKNILSRAIEVNASPKVLASAVSTKSTSGARTASNVTVVQNIYAKDTSYFGQQQEAARQLELVTRRLNN